jgi:hypothetical protein
MDFMRAFTKLIILYFWLAYFIFLFTLGFCSCLGFAYSLQATLCAVRAPKMGPHSQGRGESVAMEGGASSEAAVGFGYSLHATLYAVRVLKSGSLPKDTKTVSRNARKRLV